MGKAEDPGVYARRRTKSMELIIEVMKTKDPNFKYLRAKTRVEKLKNFYTHLVVYVVVNTVLSTIKIYRNMENGESFNEAFFDNSTFIIWLLWGIAIVLHALSIYGLPFLFNADWEERKIEQYMEEELKNK